jgi:hypothetical protein
MKHPFSIDAVTALKRPVPGFHKAAAPAAVRRCLSAVELRVASLRPRLASVPTRRVWSPASPCAGRSASLLPWPASLQPVGQPWRGPAGITADSRSPQIAGPTALPAQDAASGKAHPSHCWSLIPAAPLARASSGSPCQPATCGVVQNHQLRSHTDLLVNYWLTFSVHRRLARAPLNDCAMGKTSRIGGHNQGILCENR